VEGVEELMASACTVKFVSPFELAIHVAPLSVERKIPPPYVPT
jgi:hypothetical protein